MDIDKQPTFMFDPFSTEIIMCVKASRGRGGDGEGEGGEGDGGEGEGGKNLPYEN